MCPETLTHSVSNQPRAAGNHESRNLCALKEWQCSSSTLHQTRDVSACMSVISLCAMNGGMS